jgi:hypothetical protein
MIRFFFTAGFFLSLASPGCGTVAPGEGGGLGAPSFAVYEASIQGVLDGKGCSAAGCHYRDQDDPSAGGPGGSLRLFDCSAAPCDPDHLMANYDSAVGMSNLAIPQSSKLLTKPLAEAAGGIQHLGGDLFTDTLDPGYLTLLNWIQTPS